MIISILSLFPEIFPPVLNTSIIGRAQQKKLIDLRYIQIRDFATDKHKSVDDKPYGGGVGMLMRVDVLARAIEKAKIKKQKSKIKEKVVLLEAAGRRFTQVKARTYATLDHLILVCGHYEGIDSRISHFVDESISIGPYVLTGGELPALVITDAVTRLLPGVLIKEQATQDESFGKRNTLEAPQFTRPPQFDGYHVPEVLLSGNHAEIRKWKKEQSRLRRKLVSSIPEQCVFREK